jgi:hypothetical protein
MRTITIRQPWASLIIEGIKDIENRTWATSYRGPLLIHAGKGIDKSEWTQTLTDMPAGAIIGTVDLIDVVRDSDSEWAEADSFHWVLANPRPLPVPVSACGKLGLWNYQQ